MIRTAFMLLALLANRHWFWNVGTLEDGAWHVWAGTAFNVGMGPHVSLEWRRGRCVVHPLG